MTPPSNTRSSVRSILLIVSCLGLILTSIFLNRSSVNDIQQASASIFKDRLVPMGMLVNLTATVYRKRLLLETFVLETHKPDTAPMATTLNRLNRQTDSLLAEFEKTSLTIREASQLKSLKQQLSVYKQLENELTTNLTNQPTAQQALFAGSSSTAFSQVAHTLNDLVSLQLTVGEELLGESRGQTDYIFALTALQIGLVLLIGLSLFWHRFQ